MRITLVVIIPQMEKWIKQQVKQGKRVTIAEISDHMGYAPSFISNEYYRVRGIRIGAYIRKLCLERSLTLLARTRRQVKDIAGEVGYASSATFIRIFTATYGVSPTTGEE